MSEPATSKWDELRKPFPAESIGKLPKAGMSLDYVGHAAVTDRLLQVDPEWSWESMGVDEYGLPVLNQAGELWIKLTVNGVTRIGVGDGSTSAKQLVGDALRNAAMRFGVALDLWSREELESHVDAPELKNEKPSKLAADAKVATAIAPAAPKPKIEPTALAKLSELAEAAKMTAEDKLKLSKDVLSKDVPETTPEVWQLIAELQRRASK